MNLQTAVFSVDVKNRNFKTSLLKVTKDASEAMLYPAYQWK
jgi:hypothetical protein